MRVLRTPDERFADLTDFPYEPRYATLPDGLRMAYVEAGPADGEPVLLLHGEPTWSYLYRSVIPVLADAGFRVIAPDLIGFGRSDKPAEVADYSYARHVEWVRAFAFDALGLRGVTLVGHDWGGLIGLRVATETTRAATETKEPTTGPDAIARVVVTNTGLPTGDQQMPEVWLRFREAVRTAPSLDVSRLVAAGCRTGLAPETLAAYEAPFPDESFKAAPRAMPNLVPTTPDDPATEANRTAWRRLSEWDRPFLVAFSDNDPITSAMGPVFHRAVPGADSVTIAGAGHFIQEDAGAELADAIATWLKPPAPQQPPTAQGYTGYTSYSYLTAGVDYREFRLAEQIGRVPGYAKMDLGEAERERVRRLLVDGIAISLHDHPTVFPEDMSETIDYNRTGRQHTGYAGLARSGLTAIFDNFMDGTCCITSQMGWKWTDVIHDIGTRLSDVDHQDYVIVARRLADIRHAHETGRLALVVSTEAATMIENEVDRIDVLYGFGVRQMGIAYSEANALGSGLKERHDGGLTYFGEQAVARMNRLGIAIDVSHSGDRTSLDVIATSSKPIFVTHAGARAVWPTARMKPDEVIRALAERGGVVGIEAAPHTTLSAAHPEHSLESVMDHFTYCVDLVGIDHVAFGPDTLFGDHVGLHDTFAQHLSIAQVHGDVQHPRVPYVDGLENPAECFWNITGWLVAHGYSDDEIAQVLGGNVMRVLEEAWS